MINIIEVIKDKKAEYEYNKFIHDPKNIGKHRISPEGIKMINAAPIISMEELESK